MAKRKRTKGKHRSTNITHKTKDRLKAEAELRCSIRVSIACYIRDTRRVTVRTTTQTSSDMEFVVLTFGLHSPK